MVIIQVLFDDSKSLLHYQNRKLKKQTKTKQTKKTHTRKNPNKNKQTKKLSFNLNFEND